MSNRIGRYRVIGGLGQGAFGEVHRAVLDGPMGFRRDVAIKRLLAHRGTERNTKSLIAEARLGGLLHHANIVEVYELDRDERGWYVAMEYISGESIKSLLNRCRAASVCLPPAVALEIGIQVCRGLHHAHNLVDDEGNVLGLVHRDLKPGNLMLSIDGVVKILDFGIAKVSNQSSDTTEGALKGSPSYMSPEQAQGNSELTQASDLFALGSILFELCTGEVLFDGGNLVGTIFQVVQNDVGERTAVLDQFAPGLTTVVDGALEKEPQKRWPDARAMGQALTTVRGRIADRTVLADLAACLLDGAEPSTPTLMALCSKLSQLPEVAQSEGLAENSEPSVADDGLVLGLEALPPGPLATEEETPTTAPPMRQDLELEARKAGAKGGVLPDIRSYEPDGDLVLGVAPDNERDIPVLKPPRRSRLGSLLTILVLLAVVGWLVALATGRVAPPKIVRTVSSGDLAESWDQDATGTLAVNSEPTGAVVRVDGKDVGTTPVILEMASGKHRVVVVCKGCGGKEKWVERIEVHPERTTNLNHTF